MAVEIKTIEQRLAEKARQELINAVKAVEKQFWQGLRDLGIQWPASIKLSGFAELDSGGEPVSQSRTVTAEKFMDVFIEAATKEGIPIATDKANLDFIAKVETLVTDVEEIRSATGV